MHSMVLPLQPIASLQPIPLRKRIPVKVIPVEHTVAQRVEGPLIRPLLPVGSSIPLGRDRRPMMSRGPATDRRRLNGMPPPARTDAATCASRTRTRCAVMGTKRRAHPPKNERLSPLTLSPASMRGFSLQAARYATARPARPPPPLRQQMRFLGRHFSAHSNSCSRIFSRVARTDRPQPEPARACTERMCVVMALLLPPWRAASAASCRRRKESPAGRGHREIWTAHLTFQFPGHVGQGP